MGIWKPEMWYDEHLIDEWFGKIFFCSNCGGIMMGKTNYCSKCGEKMENPDLPEKQINYLDKSKLL